MRVLVSTLAAGLMIAMASGCGGVRPAAVRPAYTSITRHQAQAAARAVNIRAGDLPEFKTVAHPSYERKTTKVADEPSCARPSKHGGSPPRARGARPRRTARHGRSSGHGASHAPRAWASANSDRLSAGSGYHVLGASSSVSIMPTSAAARLNIAEAVRQQTCVERALRRAVAKGFHGVRGVVVTPVSITVPGADASVAYQTIVGLRGAPLTVYMDSIVFAYGQDMVTLTTYHASRPVPRSMEERLLGLLVARARAHARAR
jgi:hypothetical protein